MIAMRTMATTIVTKHQADALHQRLALALQRLLQGSCVKIAAKSWMLTVTMMRVAQGEEVHRADGCPVARLPGLTQANHQAQAQVLAQDRAAATPVTMTMISSAIPMTMMRGLEAPDAD